MSLALIECVLWCLLHSTYSLFSIVASEKVFSHSIFHVNWNVWMNKLEIPFFFSIVNELTEGIFFCFIGLVQREWEVGLICNLCNDFYILHVA